jgi:cell division ATPase FtsA
LNYQVNIRTASFFGCSLVKKKKEAGVALIIGGGTTDLAILKMVLSVILQ